MQYLIGFLLPPLVEIINKDIQSGTERYIIAIIVSLLLAAGVDWQAIMASHLSNFLQVFCIYASESNFIFNLYWKNSLVRVKLKTKLAGDSTQS